MTTGKNISNPGIGNSFPDMADQGRVKEGVAGKPFFLHSLFAGAYVLTCKIELWKK
jgi:hypothetical protein